MSKSKLIEQSWKNSIGQTISPGDKVLAVASGSVACPITKKFDIDKFEDELREKLHLDGWLKVQFFDLVED